MAVAVACLGLAVGCTSASDQAGGTKGPGHTSPTPAAEETGPISVRVTPDDGTKKVKPNAPIKVRVTGGALTKVTVKKKGGKKVHGKLAKDGTSWTSSALLRPSTSYVVRVKAKNDAHTKKARSTFTTLTPSSPVKASIAPLDGSTVGVGQPIAVYLSKPVRNRAAVERALKVTTNRHVRGVWHWFSDDELHFRPREYWPAHTKVTLHADLAGVHAGHGRWGVQNRTIKFRVGDKHVSTVNAKTHKMKVRSGGDLVKKMPVSTGRPSYPTKSGIHVVMGKADPYHMDSTTAGITGSNAYQVTVRYAVRISNSGEFVHAAPWSVGSQGSSNVSHGCVNLSTSRAAWFYNFTQTGDIVKVKGTDAKLQPTNGFGDWNVAWHKWVEGSALH